MKVKDGGPEPKDENACREGHRRAQLVVERAQPGGQTPAAHRDHRRSGDDAQCDKQGNARRTRQTDGNTNAKEYEKDGCEEEHGWYDYSADGRGR